MKKSAHSRLIQSATIAQATASLAVRVMGWKAGPDRFLIRGREWISHWRFQPFSSIEDAFRLLEKGASEYTLAVMPDGKCSARVRVDGQFAMASGTSIACTITVAVALAIGLEPDLASAPGVRKRR